MSDVDGYAWYRWAHAINAHSDAKAMTVRVALALAAHADNATGVCWPSQWTIAERCGYVRRSEDQPAPRAVQGAIAQLRRFGALRTDAGKGHKTSRYELVPCGEWAAVGRTDARPTGPVGRTDAQSDTASLDDSAQLSDATQRRTELRPELRREQAQKTPPPATATSSSPPPDERRVKEIAAPSFVSPGVVDGVLVEDEKEKGEQDIEDWFASLTSPDERAAARRWFPQLAGEPEPAEAQVV